MKYISSKAGPNLSQDTLSTKFVDKGFKQGENLNSTTRLQQTAIQILKCCCRPLVPKFSDGICGN